MSYQYIINPNTGRKNKITSKQGKQLIKNYLKSLRGGYDSSIPPPVPDWTGTPPGPPPRPPPGPPPAPYVDDLEARLRALEDSNYVPDTPPPIPFFPTPLPDDNTLNDLQNERKEYKDIADTLTAQYKIRYPDGPDVRNPGSVGDDYHEQRRAVHNLVTKEEEIKDIVQQHTDYTDEDIFECLDEHDFNIKETIQCLEEL